MTPAAFVQSSAQATLNQRSALVTVTGSMHAGPVTLPLAGTGAVNFSARTFRVDMHLSANGVTVLEQEVAAGGRIYLHVQANGQSIGGADGGRPWVALPVVPNSDGGGISGGDPVSGLRLLASQGNVVRSLGTAVMNGRQLTGYSVTVPREVLMREVDRYLAGSGLSSSQRSGLARVAGTIHPLTLAVWFDHSRLLRKMTVSLSLGSVVPVQGSVVFSFDHYGTPVTIQAPPASQVASFAAVVGAEPNARQDAAVKSDLRNLATIEETYLTDSAASYGTAAQLRATMGSELSALSPHDVIAIHLDGAQGYCLAARAGARRYWIYSSEDGGIADAPASSDSCNRSRFPVYGGSVG
jgi:hypothetical protein